MDIQVYADSFSAEAENEVVNVTLRNVDLSLLIGQFNIKDVLEAITANDGYGDITDYVSDSGEEE